MHILVSRVFVPMAVMFLAMPNAVGQASIDALRAELDANWKTLGAFSATMRIKAQGKDGAIKMSSELEGPLVVARGDGVTRYSTRLSGSARLGPLGLIRIAMGMTAVSDGETIHDEQTMRGKARVTVTRDPEHLTHVPAHGAAILGDAASKYRLEALPEETIGGTIMCVVRGTRIDPGETQEKYTVWKIQKLDGILISQTAFDKKDNALAEISFSEINLAPSISAEAFVYVIPEGAKVTRKVRTKDGAIEDP